MNEIKGKKPLTDFFDNLASFDTETTGTNAKVDRIWQAGFTRKGIDTEEVVNPFYRFNKDQKVFEPEKLSVVEFQDKVININKDFSRKAYERGDFTELLHQHHVPDFIGHLPENSNLKRLSYSLSDTIDKTLGNLSTSDILVLQNHNFENRLLQQGREDGILSTDTYKRIQDKMEYLDIDPKTKQPKGLLQTPIGADKYARQATFIYQTELRSATSNPRVALKSYTSSLNKMMDSYKEAIDTPGRKAVVVEQMDITKAMYANAVQRGYLSASNLNVGLSMDFLTNVLLDRAELHTALSDSKDTIEVFKKTWQMTEELRTGDITPETKRLLVRINEAQNKEAYKQFMSTVTSVAKDFATRGYTNYSVGNINLKGKNILSSTTGDVVNLRGASTYRGALSRPHITDFATAMNSVLSSYSNQSHGDIREDFISKVKTEYFDKGATAALTLSEDMKAEFKLDDLPIVKNVNVSPSWWKEPTTLFGKEITRGTKVGIIGAGVGLLGYMAMKGSPEKREENSYVAQQFYDEQYLGTEFVNFNNRNKHYMY